MARASASDARGRRLRQYPDDGRDRRRHHRRRRPLRHCQRFSGGRGLRLRARAERRRQLGSGRRAHRRHVGFGGHFGGSLALAGDLLVVGASVASDHHGQVRIFERDRGGTDNGARSRRSPTPRSATPATSVPSAARSRSRAICWWSAPPTPTSADLYMGDGAAYVFRRNQSDVDQWDYVTRLVAPGADQCTGGRPLGEFWSDPGDAGGQGGGAALRDRRTSPRGR